VALAIFKSPSVVTKTPYIWIYSKITCPTSTIYQDTPKNISVLPVIVISRD
jgi:hypothetical protein